MTFVKVTFDTFDIHSKVCHLIMNLEHLNNASNVWKLIVKIEVPFAKLIELFVHFMVDIIDTLNRLFIL